MTCVSRAGSEHSPNPPLPGQPLHPTPHRGSGPNAPHGMPGICPSGAPPWGSSGGASNQTHDRVWGSKRCPRPVPRVKHRKPKPSGREVRGSRGAGGRTDRGPAHPDSNNSSGNPLVGSAPPTSARHRASSRSHRPPARAGRPARPSAPRQPSPPPGAPSPERAAGAPAPGPRLATPTQCALRGHLPLGAVGWTPAGRGVCGGGHPHAQPGSSRSSEPIEPPRLYLPGLSPARMLEKHFRGSGGGKGSDTGTARGRGGAAPPPPGQGRPNPWARGRGTPRAGTAPAASERPTPHHSRWLAVSCHPDKIFKFCKDSHRMTA